MLFLEDPVSVAIDLRGVGVDVGIRVLGLLAAAALKPVAQDRAEAAGPWSGCSGARSTRGRRGEVAGARARARLAKDAIAKAVSGDGAQAWWE